jgi:hypothetical protein
MAARAFFLAVANFFALLMSSQLALLTSDSIGILLVISNNMLAFFLKKNEYSELTLPSRHRSYCNSLDVINLSL